MKRKVNLYIEETTLETDKNLGLNLSRVTENALLELTGLIRSRFSENAFPVAGKRVQVVGVRRFELPTKPFTGAKALMEINSSSGTALDHHQEPKQRVGSTFLDYCKLNLQLCHRTAKKYSREMERFFESGLEVNAYLRERSYANGLRALKAYAKYIGKKELMADYRFPRKDYKIRKVDRATLSTFFNALRDDRERALFLIYASSGLRKSEILTIRKADVDFGKRMLTPSFHEGNSTKNSYVSFYNEEAEHYLKKYLASREDNGEKLFAVGHSAFCRMWRDAGEKTGIHLSQQDLRFWFCSEMGGLGVGDRYVDAMCGRVPKSVLARHYTEYSPERIRSIYEKAGLRVFSEGKMGKAG